jgi:hypothetical protein
MNTKYTEEDLKEDLKTQEYELLDSCECLDASDCPANYESVDVMSPLIRVNCFQILSVSHYVVLVYQAISAQHIPGHPGDIEGLPTVVPFHHRDHLWGKETLVLQSRHAMHRMEAKSNLSEHICHFLLLDLHPSQRLVELSSLQLIIHSLLKTEFGSTHCTPGNSVSCLVQAAKWSFQTFYVKHVFLWNNAVIEHYHASV